MPISPYWKGSPVPPFYPYPTGMGRVPVWEWIWAALGTPVIYAPYTIHGTPLYTQYRGVGSIGVPRAITNSTKTIPSTPHTYYMGPPCLPSMVSRCEVGLRDVGSITTNMGYIGRPHVSDTLVVSVMESSPSPYTPRRGVGTWKVP